MSDQTPNICKDTSYIALLESVKARIQASQHQVAMYVNSELIYTYWNIGYHLTLQRDQQGWGSKVVDQLAADLKSSFPSMKGFSKRNLQYMMKFATEWPIESFAQEGVAQLDLQDPSRLDSATPKVPQTVAQIQNTDNQKNTIMPQAVAQFQNFENHAFARVPWSHHRVMLDKIEDRLERQYYCEQIIANGWSRKVLLHKIDQGLYQSKGKLGNNFVEVLPIEQATLVTETFKDPYFFDFLQLGEEASERAIEDSLIAQIEKFLLELGAGFAYMGRQYKLEVGGKDYFLDLLFFHTQLNCYVNIELKIDEFKPEYAGKSQFYLTAIDEQLKAAHHNPSVGIILCKEANSIVVEYTLRQSSVPLGVAEYKLVHDLPETLQGFIPSPDQLKASLKDK